MFGGERQWREGFVGFGCYQAMGQVKRGVNSLCEKVVLIGRLFEFLRGEILSCIKCLDVWSKGNRCFEFFDVEFYRIR